MAAQRFGQRGSRFPAILDLVTLLAAGATACV